MKSRIGRYCSSMFVASRAGRCVARGAVLVRVPAGGCAVPDDHLALRRPLTARSASYATGAHGETRTPTGYPTAPSRQRVYQFHHVGAFHNYFGTSPDFEPAGALSGAAFAGSAAGAAPRAGGTSFAFGAIFSTIPCCITPFGGPCVVAYHVRPRLVAKKIAARTAVVRDRKLAEPAAPKIVPDEPLP